MSVSIMGVRWRAGGGSRARACTHTHAGTPHHTHAHSHTHPPPPPRVPQLLGMKGADRETNIWKIRLQLMKPVTWIPLITENPSFYLPWYGLGLCIVWIVVMGTSLRLFRDEDGGGEMK